MVLTRVMSLLFSLGGIFGFLFVAVRRLHFHMHPIYVMLMIIVAVLYRVVYRPVVQAIFAPDPDPDEDD